MKLKVLILTYYFPPAGGSGVQRWLKFVKYLPSYNIEPVIYTVKDPNYPITDESLFLDLPKDLEVLRYPIFEPNNFISKFSKKNNQSAGFLNKKPTFLGKVSQYIRANYFMPDSRKFWIKPSVKYLEKYLKNNHIDVIITTGPPHSVHLIGLALKEKTNIQWIADFRDPWTDIDYFHQLPLTKKAINKHHQLEQAVLKKADQVIVIGKTMQEKYLPFNKNTVVIPNGFDDFKTSLAINMDKKFSLLHIGMLNSDRNHTFLWETLSELSQENNNFKTNLEIKLIGKVCPEALKSIHKNKLSFALNHIDYVKHHEVFKHQKSAQVLILLINNVPSAKGIVTGKIFEYLQAKRPILAIAPSEGDLAEIIKKTNAGKVIEFNEKEKLKKHLKALYENYKKNTLAINSKNIDQYHRKKLTGKLVQLLKELKS